MEDLNVALLVANYRTLGRAEVPETFHVRPKKLPRVVVERKAAAMSAALAASVSVDSTSAQQYLEVAACDGTMCSLHGMHFVSCVAASLFIILFFAR
jgi:hypothetical protein